MRGRAIFMAVWTPQSENELESHHGGYVFRNQPLVGSMALDLIAVLFGGVVAILPIFAKDILQIGPAGLGFLRASPAVGAVLMARREEQPGEKR